MTRGEKIAQARREMGRDWTQERFAAELRKVGAEVSRNWVAHLETDSIRKPLRQVELEAMARVLHRPLSYFADDKPSSVGFGHVARHGGEGLAREEAPAGVDITSFAGANAFIPVLGAVAADRFSFSLDAVPEEQIPNPYAGKKVFALRVDGDCMEPTFRDGEYIYFSVTQPLMDGKIVLARLDGEHTLKRYFKRPNGVELRPDNPAYKGKLYATNKLEIVAVAVGRWQKL